MQENYKKTIIIFGGSGGIGFEVARYFYDKGYNLVVTYNKNSKRIKDFAKKKGQKKKKNFKIKIRFLHLNAVF